MANTRAGNKASSAKATDDTKTTTEAKAEDTSTQEQTNTGSDEQAKDTPSTEAEAQTGIQSEVKTADNGGDDSSVEENPATGVGTAQADTEGDLSDADVAGADSVKADIKDTERALAENPDAPEEAKTTGFLPGTEIPVNAPGTEGLPHA